MLGPNGILHLKQESQNPILPLPCNSFWDQICEFPVLKEHNLNAWEQLAWPVC